MYVTPGPNNSILTASGIKFGFVRSIPNVLGIPTGHGLQLALVCLGLGTLFITYPILYDVLRYVGSAYILFLAYKMFGSLNVAKTEDRSRPLKYYEAILFQFVNPKAWVICSTAVTLYYPKGENIIIGTLFMFIMSIRGSQNYNRAYLFVLFLVLLFLYIFINDNRKKKIKYE